MTTPSPADGLRECLALLERATRGRWSQDTGGDITMDDGTTLFTRELPGGDSDISFANANLVEAAVNFLRDHGPALLAALREVEKLRVRVKLADHAVSRWVPCPDHRDKTERGICYVCENERLKLAALRLREACE